MKKLVIAASIVALAVSAEADETAAELTRSELAETGSWRVGVGGFGRGNMDLGLKGMGTRHATVYGTDLDVQYKVWENENFDLWAGVGGTFCSRQKASGHYRRTSSRSEHQVSDDGYTTYDFNYVESATSETELGYGEFRMMLVPEWKVTERFALGARLGVAFDWLNARCSGRDDWAWNSKFNLNIPGVPPETDTDGDTGGSRWSESETKFAAQAILGLQATYLFTENLGLYGCFDWRLGGDTEFGMGDGRKMSVDMDGWYWGAGVVFQF